LEVPGTGKKDQNAKTSGKKSRSCQYQISKRGGNKSCARGSLNRTLALEKKDVHSNAQSMKTEKRESLLNLSAFEHTTIRNKKGQPNRASGVSDVGMWPATAGGHEVTSVRVGKAKKAIFLRERGERPRIKEVRMTERQGGSMKLFDCGMY